MELAAISTGRVFAEAQVWMTHPDPSSVRSRAVSLIKGLIDLAVPFKSRVNVGRARGPIPPGEQHGLAEHRFIGCMAACAECAAPLGVDILLEPVNRYEINFVNNVTEGIEMARRIGRPNVKLMPDVFHMNIKDVSITGSFEKAGLLVGYVHFADSNRLAPGQGHPDFPAILASLKKIGYNGYVTVEILPYPDPDTAAWRAISHLRTLIPTQKS